MVDLHTPPGPSLKVTGGYGIPVYDLPDGRRNLGDQALDVTVLNEGGVRVTVTGVSFEIEGRTELLPGIDWLVESPRPLPIVLEPGEQWHAMMLLAPIHDALAARYGGDTFRVRAVAAAGARRFAATWQEV